MQNHRKQCLQIPQENFEKIQKLGSFIKQNCVCFDFRPNSVTVPNLPPSLSQSNFYRKAGSVGPITAVSRCIMAILDKTRTPIDLQDPLNS